jgi:hypothetical protein
MSRSILLSCHAVLALILHLEHHLSWVLLLLREWLLVLVLAVLVLAVLVLVLKMMILELR